MFSEVFSKLLQIHNITAYKVSKDTGISKGLMENYKKGNRVPTGDNLKKIADYFDVPIDYLLERGGASNSVVNHGTIGVQAYEYSNNHISNSTDPSPPPELSHQIVDGISAEILKMLNNLSTKDKAAVLTFICELEEQKRQKK